MTFHDTHISWKSLGSGKSCSAVREILKDESNRKYYTNLKIFKAKNTVMIKPENVIEKKFIKETKKRDGTVAAI